MVSLLATVGAGALAWRERPVPRRWGVTTAIAAYVAVALAGLAQGSLREVERDWPAFEQVVATNAGQLLKGRIRAVEDELRQAATRALDTPADPVQSFTFLDPLDDAPEERGIVVYRGTRPIAWAGRVRVLPGDVTITDGLGIAASEFYLAVYAAAQRDSTTALAMALVHAVPPADRLATTVAGRVIEETLVDGFAFAPARVGGEGAQDEARRASVVIGPPDAPLFEATPIVMERGAARLELIERARLRVGAALAIALVIFVVAAWRAGRSLAWRTGALAVALGCTSLAPLNELSNLTRLFDSAVYYTPLGGPLTANAGALLLTGAILLLGLLAFVRRHHGRIGRVPAVAAVLLVAGLGPFLLRDLARGIQIPPTGMDAALWMIWEIPLFLAAVSVLIVGATAGGVVLGSARGLSPMAGPSLAGAAALLAPVVWQAPAGWPWWYTFLWVGAIVALVLARPSHRTILAASLVAAFGATTLVWANTARGRVALAERELARLERPDADAVDLLRRFAYELAIAAPMPSRQGLLQAYVGSDLADAGYPASLAMWTATGTDTAATLRTGALDIRYPELQRMVLDAAAERTAVIRALPAWPGVQLALAAPAGGGIITTVVGPRTSLIPPDPVSRLISADRAAAAEPPYSIRLGAPVRASAREERWRREGSSLRGVVPVETAAGTALGFVDVELRPLAALVQRGVLLVRVDLLLVGLLWTLTVVADGRLGRWIRTRRRQWSRSYRARLSLALFLFFVVPAVAFAVWSYQQLLVDGRQTRILLLRETLRAAARPDVAPDWVTRESRRLETPLLLYDEGLLVEASEPLYASLAPTGLLLRPEVALGFALGDEIVVSRADGKDESLQFGYRAVEAVDDGERVIAAPARTGDVALDRRRQDLAILVLFATAAGALAALALSGVAARQLATPVGMLRRAAMAIARGDREPALEREPPAEFRPVFSAFSRMAADLSASRNELEEAQRRTAAVLRNVASGVIAVDADGRVTLANPRAEALLGAELLPGARLAKTNEGVAGIAMRFIGSRRDVDEFDVELHGVQLRGQVTRLGEGAAVLTLDDITELARAQRVLAWGEMARQVAHEIKNPLTPIRLGVQHLRRARRDPRVDFDTVLDQNVTRILEEIDRLDEIARAFSKYGSAPAERAPAEPVDVARVVRGLATLETMGDGGTRFLVEGVDDGVMAMAQANELHEVLLNLVENARLAEAREVRVDVASRRGEVSIVVRDDGHGIPPDVLPRIFEPHFSTRTSGSGLGLAISRQLVEGWGGSIAVKTAMGEGTEVTVKLRAASGSSSHS